MINLLYGMAGAAIVAGMISIVASIYLRIRR